MKKTDFRDAYINVVKVVAMGYGEKEKTHSGGISPPLYMMF